MRLSSISKARRTIFGLTIVLLAQLNAAHAQIEVRNPIQTEDFTGLAASIIRWLLSIVGGLSLLMLVYGGIVYITSGGDQQKVQQGKKIITWTIFGLLLVLMSYSILSLLSSLLSNNPATPAA